MTIATIIRILQIAAALLGLFTFGIGQQTASQVAYGGVPDVIDIAGTALGGIGSIGMFALSWFLQWMWGQNSDLAKSILQMLSIPGMLKAGVTNAYTMDQKGIVVRVVTQIVDLICNRAFPGDKEIEQSGQQFVTAVLKKLGLVNATAVTVPAPQPVAPPSTATINIPSIQ